MDWQVVFHPFSILLAVVVAVAVFLMAKRTDRDNNEVFETSLPWFTVGKARISSSLALIVAAIVGGVYGYPAIETARNDSLVKTRDGTITTLREQISDKNTKIEELGRTIGEQANAAIDASARIKELDEQIISLDAGIGRKDAEIKRIEEDLGAKEKEYEEREAKSTSDLTKLRVEKERLEEQLKLAEGELKRVTHYSQRLEQQLSDTLILLRERGLSQADQDFLENAERSMEELNNALDFVQIRRVTTPVVGDFASWPTFEIVSKHALLPAQPARGGGLFAFYSESYIFNNTYGEEFVRVVTEDLEGLTTELCRAVSTALSSSSRMSDILDQTDIWQKFSEDRDFIGRVVETEFLLQRLAADYSLVEFFTQGYADGELGAWKHDLPQDLAEGRVHLRDDARNTPGQYVEFFVEQETVVELGVLERGQLTYGNEQLPNLRGHQTKLLLSNLTDACTGPGLRATFGDVGQLDGKAFEDVSRNDRKSRVYFRISLEE